MKKTLVIAVIAPFALGLFLAMAYMAWSWNDLRERAEQLEQLVTVSWGDGRYGPAFYGAYVYYERGHGFRCPPLTPVVRPPPCSAVSMFATGYPMMLRFLFTQIGDESGSRSAKIPGSQICDVKRSAATWASQ